MRSLDTPNPGQKSGVRIHDVLYVLFKHKGRIAFLALLGLAAAGFFLHLHLTKPNYESQAKLLIRYIIERNSVDPEGPDGRGEGLSITDTELEILQSLDLAIATAEKVGPGKLVEVTMAPPSAAEAAGRILAGMTAEAGQSENVIYLTYKDRDPDLVVDVLTQHIQAYFARHLKIHRSTDAFEQVAVQTGEAQKALRSTQDEINKLKSDAGILSIESTIAEFEGRRQMTRGFLLSAKTLMAEQEAKVAALEQVAVEKPPVGGKAAPRKETVAEQMERRRFAEAFAEYQDLSARLELLRAERNQLSVRRPNHDPAIVSLDNHIATGQRKLLDLAAKYPEVAKKAGSDGVFSGVGSLDDERAVLHALEARVQTIGKQVSDIENEVAGLSDLGFRLENLERRRTLEEEKLQALQTRLEKARLDETLDPGHIPNIAILQSPSTPVKAVDHVTMGLIGGFAGGGLLLGVGLAFLREWVVDRRITRPAEIQTRLQIPLMMSVPFIRSTDGLTKLIGADGAGELAPLNAMPGGSLPAQSKHFIAPYAEAMRDRIIFNFQINNLDHKPKLIGVSGVTAGAGASTVAAGIAKAFSEDGNKVLLVDLNSNARQEDAAAYPSRSLLKALEMSKDRLFRESPRNLYVVGAPMRREKNRGNSFTPHSLHEIMPNVLASDYDVVIFDLPQADPTSPALSVAGFMDKVLLVVDGEYTTRESLSWAYTELERGRADVSCIFNKAKSHAPSWVENTV